MLLGFVLPVLLLARLVWHEARWGEVGLPLAALCALGLASFELAALAALLATALALALGFALRLPRSAQRGGLLPLAARVVSLGYAVPGAVIAVGILLPLGWLQERWPEAPLPALRHRHGVRACCTPTWCASRRWRCSRSRPATRGVPTSLDDTARMLGASRARLLGSSSHLPLLRRSALAAALLVFVDVMKELPATLVLRPFDSDTLAVVAYNLARDERLAEAALPSLAIVAVGLLPVLLLSRAMRR